MTPIVRQTIMSQYANSPALMTIIDQLSDRIGVDPLVNEFLDRVIRISSARGFGLDVWGRIVGISRRTMLPDPDQDYFGFSTGFHPFNQAPFFSTLSVTSTYLIPDNEYRHLIMLKAYVNIIDATALNINHFLRQLFPQGYAYFRIVGHMQAEYVFEFELSPLERYLVYNTDILPRPCGVSISILEIPVPDIFGFYGTGFQPFNQGVFTYVTT